MKNSSNPKPAQQKVKAGKKYLVQKLEQRFHETQARITKAREHFLNDHKKELEEARSELKVLQSKFTKAKTRVAKAVARSKQAGARGATKKLKKARAASLLLADALHEAKEILLTAESRLQAAKPFDRKLAARAKALAQFEKDWEKKIEAEAQAKAVQAKELQQKARQSSARTAP